jgi:hypothetical protein
MSVAIWSPIIQRGLDHEGLGLADDQGLLAGGGFYGADQAARTRLEPVLAGQEQIGIGADQGGAGQYEPGGQFQFGIGEIAVETRHDDFDALGGDLEAGGGDSLDQGRRPDDEDAPASGPAGLEQGGGGFRTRHHIFRFRHDAEAAQLGGEFGRRARRVVGYETIADAVVVPAPESLDGFGDWLAAAIDDPVQVGNHGNKIGKLRRRNQPDGMSCSGTGRSL